MKIPLCLVDTHCHINTMIKQQFDTLLTTEELERAQAIILKASNQQVDYIINVGTSVIESKNCIALAKRYRNCYASIGIHPNDCTEQWKTDIKELKKLLQTTNDHTIVAIGECGIDKHYPDYNLPRQRDVFRAQIELALEYHKALIVHTRNAGDETLQCLDEFSQESLRGVIHCFSENSTFAQHVIAMGFVLGLGGTITYPKNTGLRDIAQATSLENIILETDAPFLPPQIIRGKQNHPHYIAYIAQYLAELKNCSLQDVAQQTTANALRIFSIVPDK
jgi:TatD DNase family protein